MNPEPMPPDNAGMDDLRRRLASLPDDVAALVGGRDTAWPDLGAAAPPGASQSIQGNAAPIDAQPGDQDRLADLLEGILDGGRSQWSQPVPRIDPPGPWFHPQQQTDVPSAPLPTQATGNAQTVVDVTHEPPEPYQFAEAPSAPSTPAYEFRDDVTDVFSQPPSPSFELPDVEPPDSPQAAPPRREDPDGITSPGDTPRTDDDRPRDVFARQPDDAGEPDVPSSPRAAAAAGGDDFDTGAQSSIGSQIVELMGEILKAIEANRPAAGAQPMPQAASSPSNSPQPTPAMPEITPGAFPRMADAHAAGGLAPWEITLAGMRGR